MNKRIILSLAASTLLATSGLAFAQAPDAAPATPRADQVDTRVQNQESHINNAEAAGKITPAQAAKDTAKDDKVAAKVSKDEAKNGGDLTAKQQKKENKKLNKTAKKVHKQEKKDGTAATPASK